MGNHCSVISAETANLSLFENKQFQINLQVHKIPFIFFVKCDPTDLKMVLKCVNPQCKNWQILMELRIQSKSSSQDVKTLHHTFKDGESMAASFNAREIFCGFRGFNKSTPFLVQLQFAEAKLLKFGSNSLGEEDNLKKMMDELKELRGRIDKQKIESMIKEAQRPTEFQQVSKMEQTIKEKFILEQESVKLKTENQRLNKENIKFKTELERLKKENQKILNKVAELEEDTKSTNFSPLKLVEVTTKVDGNRFFIPEKMIEDHCPKLLKENMKTPNQMEIDVSSSTFQAVINFFSSRNIPKNNLSQISDLLVISIKYEIGDLKKFCENCIVAQLTVDNAIDLILEYKEKDMGQLRAIIIKFMAKNIIKLRKTPKWKEFSRNNDEILAEIVAHI